MRMIPIAISNIAWTQEQDAEVYDLMRDFGLSGLEIAPTRVFPNSPYEDLLRAEQWAEALLQKEGFRIPSMQSIWFGRSENIFESEEARDALLCYAKKAVDFAAAIHCRNLVFGCPRNRNVPEGADISVAVPFFRALGDYAAAKGCCIGMEANPPIYNTNYINTTQEALQLVQSVDSPGFGLNLDVGTMVYAGEDVEVLRGQVNCISHVHISEPYLKPVQKRSLHGRLAALLTEESYQGFISVEMARTEGTEQIHHVLKYISNLLS